MLVINNDIWMIKLEEMNNQNSMNLFDKEIKNTVIVQLIIDKNTSVWVEEVINNKDESFYLLKESYGDEEFCSENTLITTDEKIKEIIKVENGLEIIFENQSKLKIIR